MADLVKLGRAWAPVVKAAALFVLPLPLVAAAVLELAHGDLRRFALSGGGLAALWGAGALAAAALGADARYFLGTLTTPPRLPLKALSLAATVLGASLAALAGTYDWAGVALFGALAGLGHRAFFGPDLRAHRVSVAALPGVDVAAVTAQLEQAYGRLQGLERAAAAIAVPEFGERLRRITAIGRRILAEIEQDPRDAARARKFLNVYLDGAGRITADYARTHRQLRQRALEDNFRQLLIDIEANFDAQHRKLLEHEALALDVEIEVLAARLKREGVS